jgi:hypothetical protein
MTVLLTLTIAGIDTGPFDLYSNVDGYSVPFETNISKAALQGGYSSVLVPDFAIVVRVVSKGVCNTYVDIVLASLTTTTSTAVPTTTTTTTSGVTVEFSAAYTQALEAPLGDSDAGFLSGNITITGGSATFFAFAEIFVDAGVGSNFLTDIDIAGNLATAFIDTIGMDTSAGIVLGPGIYSYTIDLSVNSADGGGGISYTI